MFKFSNNSNNQQSKEESFYDLCRNNKFDEIKIAIDAGEIREKWIQKAFLPTFSPNCLDMMKFLVEYENIDFDFREAYSIAIANRQFEIAEWIISENFHLSLPNNSMISFKSENFLVVINELFESCSNGNQENIEKLLKIIPGDIWFLEKSLTIISGLALAEALYNKNGYTLEIDDKFFLNILNCGFVDNVRWLFDKYEKQFCEAIEDDINDYFRDFCERGNLDMLKFLYEKFPEKINICYQNGIFFELAERKEEITSFLEFVEKDIKEKKSRKIFIYCLKSNIVDITRCLFDNFEDQFREAIKDDINEYFSEFCSNENLDMLKFLYEKFPDDIDIYYETGIFFERSICNTEITSFLKDIRNNCEPFSSEVYIDFLEYGDLETSTFFYEKFEKQFREAIEDDINEHFHYFCNRNSLEMIQFLYDRFSDKIDLHYGNNIFFREVENNKEITEFLKSKL